MSHICDYPKCSERRGQFASAFWQDCARELPLPGQFYLVLIASSDFAQIKFFMDAGNDRLTGEPFPPRWETIYEVTHWLKGVPAFPTNRKREKEVKIAPSAPKPKVKITLEELEI